MILVKIDLNPDLKVEKIIKVVLERNIKERNLLKRENGKKVKISQGLEDLKKEAQMLLKRLELRKDKNPLMLCILLGRLRSSLISLLVWVLLLVLRLNFEKN